MMGMQINAGETWNVQNGNNKMQVVVLGENTEKGGYNIRTTSGKEQRVGSVERFVEKVADAPNAQPETDAPKSKRGRKPLGQMSLLDAAVTVLRESGEPMQVKDITAAVLKRGLAQTGGKTPAATLSASMGREVAERGEDARFAKVSRGTYASV
jgi:hypothetical protein